MSSKADDFDVRYREPGAAGQGRAGADGGYRGNGGGTVDYDLDYGDQGFDTDGFRSPEADFADSREPDYVRAGGVGTAVRTGRGQAPRGQRAGSHARATGGAAPGNQDTGQLGWEADATGGLWAPETPVRADPGQPGSPYRRGTRGLPRPGRRRLDPARGKVKGSWWRHWTLRKALGVLLCGVGAFIVLGAIAVALAYEATPVPTGALAETAFSQSVVYSANGTLIGRFGTTNRQMLTYGQLSQSKWLIPAVLAAEDRNFFTEGGISPTGIMRAAYADATGGNGSLQGGSTITQEFVRQYYSGIGTQQTFSRKIKEIFVAMKVAKEKSKPWILTNYLNTIYFGQGAYGVQAAAMTYYNKPVAKLTVAQAAVIAAIIQQPSTYPLKPYRAQLENRWHYVLNGMVLMGKLTQQQADSLKFPPPGDYVPHTVGRDVWDPYVLNMVYNELTDVYHFSQSQIYNGGYTIRTSIDDSKMASLYAAVRDNIAVINQSGKPFEPTYMHAGAVLEDPATGAIEALYPGPGYPGSKYNGTGKVISASYCKKIACEVNMAVYNREQVGSSFKPYILATAVKQGMNVKTSTLDGFNNLFIPPDTEPATYPATAMPAGQSSWYLVHNDSMAENGPYTPQMAMAISINTAYANLWHVVAGSGGNNVVRMAQAFGVNTDLAGITAGPDPMHDQAGIALGQASLTVGEQATMLATLADNGVFHDAHVITKITQNSAPPTPIKITNYPVFSSDPQQNANLASQVQYAMSKDDAPYGTAPGAGMSNGQEIIAKTGTTNTAQSAFFIGAIPNQALAVALFTNQQGKGTQTLNDLGGNSQGGFGGTWPAAIWHTYAEDRFVPLGIEQWPTPVFTGTPWNEVPPGLRNVQKKHKKHDHGNQNGNPFGLPTTGPNNPFPWPTYSCDPNVVTCATDPGNGGGGGNGNAVGNPTPNPNASAAGAAVGGVLGLPATLLCVRRRKHERAKGPRPPRAEGGQDLKSGPEASGTAQTRLDMGVDAPGSTDTRFGGGAGRSGPVTLAVALGSTSVLVGASLLGMLLAFAEKYPCRSGAWNFYVKQFQDSCYTDIYPLYYGEGLSAGKVPYTGHPVEYPVLIGGAMQAAAWLVRNVSQVIRGREFFDVTVVLLAICAVAGVLATARAAGPGGRAQALMVALSPALILSAFVNWDLIAFALTALGIAAWAGRRGVWAGVLLGLAVAAKFYPLVVFGPLLLLCLRAGQLREFAKTLAAAVVAWLAVNLPVMIVAPSGWATFYVYSKDRPGDWGSIWYMLEHFNVPVLRNGQVSDVNRLAEIFFAVACAAIILLALAAPRRPRLPQLCYLVLAAFLMTNKVWSPQYVVWLVPLAVLARPRLWPYLLWQLAEIAYFFGIWGYLIFVFASEGNQITGYGGISTGWYFATLLARFLAVALLAAYVVRDILYPERDVVRARGLDDPAGGVLDQAEDRFRLRLRPRQAGPSRADAASAS